METCQLSKFFPEYNKDDRMSSYNSMLQARVQYGRFISEAPFKSLHSQLAMEACLLLKFFPGYNNDDRMSSYSLQ